jgi:hypothetical protein
LLHNPRKGLKPAQISPLAEKGISALTYALIFGKLAIATSRDSRDSPAQPGFCISRVGCSSQNKLTTRANQFARGASVCENLVPFKRCDTTRCVVAVRSCFCAGRLDGGKSAPDESPAAFITASRRSARRVSIRGVPPLRGGREALPLVLPEVFEAR